MSNTELNVANAGPTRQRSFLQVVCTHLEETETETDNDGEWDGYMIEGSTWCNENRALDVGR